MARANIDIKPGTEEVYVARHGYRWHFYKHLVNAKKYADAGTQVYKVSLTWEEVDG